MVSTKSCSRLGHSSETLSIGSRFQDRYRKMRTINSGHFSASGICLRILQVQSPLQNSIQWSTWTARGTFQRRGMIIEYHKYRALCKAGTRRSKWIRQDTLQCRSRARNAHKYRALHRAGTKCDSTMRDGGPSKDWRKWNHRHAARLRGLTKNERKYGDKLELLVRTPSLSGHLWLVALDRTQADCSMY